MRNTFVKTLFEIAKKDKNVILITGDLGYNVFEEYKKELPNQYINIGVCEQNMIGVSAGLAHEGKKVFAYSIVPFATLRCLEQIRNDVAYHNLPVVIVGVGGGYSYGMLGATHHAIEDYGILKTIPNMTIVCPGDPIEVESAVCEFYRIKGCGYLRLARSGEPDIHKRPISFSFGTPIIVTSGKDISIISTGGVLELALEAVNELKNLGIEAELISVHTIKPLQWDIILNSIKKTGNVITIEEHNIIGGFGQDVATMMYRNSIQARFMNLGIQDKFMHVVGSQSYLRDCNNINQKSIVEQSLKWLK